MVNPVSPNRNEVDKPHYLNPSHMFEELRRELCLTEELSVVYPGYDHLVAGLKPVGPDEISGGQVESLKTAIREGVFTPRDGKPLHLHRADVGLITLGRYTDEQLAEIGKACGEPALCVSVQDVVHPYSRTTHARNFALKLDGAGVMPYGSVPRRGIFIDYPETRELVKEINVRARLIEPFYNVDPPNRYEQYEGMLPVFDWMINENQIHTAGSVIRELNEEAQRKGFIPGRSVLYTVYSMEHIQDLVRQKPEQITDPNALKRSYAISPILLAVPGPEYPLRHLVYFITEEGEALFIGDKYQTNWY